MLDKPILQASSNELTRWIKLKKRGSRYSMPRTRFPRRIPPIAKWLYCILLLWVFSCGLYFTVTNSASTSYMELRRMGNGVHSYSGTMFFLLGFLLILLGAYLVLSMRKK
jgi:hypothetical protein